MTSIFWKFLPGLEHLDPDYKITMTANPEDWAGAPGSHLCGQLRQLSPQYPAHPTCFLLWEENFSLCRWQHVSTPVLSDKLWLVKPVLIT